MGGDDQMVRRMLLRSAVWLPTGSIAVLIASSAGIFARGGLVERFQTLIGAGVALLAAVIAVRPVWQQLERLATQTNAALREILTDRLQEVGRRKELILADLKVLEAKLSRQTVAMIEAESDEVDSEWAFAQSQQAGRTIDRLREVRRMWRDAPEITAAFDAVETQLDVLYDLLDDIHRPDSVDRYDDELDISDEDWAKLESDAATAREGLVGASHAYDQAVAGVAAAFESEEDALRDRIAVIDQALMRGRI